MKRAVTIFCMLALVCGATLVLATGWNNLWGKWEQKGNPHAFVVFSQTNIVVSVRGHKKSGGLLAGQTWSWG